jgi:hypothetical protein
MAVLPRFPLVWLSCNQEEAELVIIHSSFDVIVIVVSPPSPANEISPGETASNGSGSPSSLQDTTVDIPERVKTKKSKKFDLML